MILDFFLIPYNNTIERRTHLAATAAEPVTAHGIMGKCALFTAGSSTADALLQTTNTKTSLRFGSRKHHAASVRTPRQTVDAAPICSRLKDWLISREM